MKKKIKILYLLIFSLIILSSLIIAIFGKTCTITFNIPKNEDYKITISNNRIKILDEIREDNKIIIKVKGIYSGIVYLNLEHESLAESKMLYVHKNMIITSNNFFGKSNGSEVIPISVSIIILYILFILISEYRNESRKNLYQYKSVSYLGLIIYISFFAIINIISIFNYNGIYGIVNNFIHSTIFLSTFMFPIALITFIFVTINNIILLKREGKSLRNLLGVFFGIFICFLTLLPDFYYKLNIKYQIFDIYNLNAPGPYIYSFIETFVYLIVSYLECLLIGTIIITIKSANRRLAYNKDYMIILGCKISGDGTLTPLLKGRVDKAIEFRNKQLKETGKDLIFIPSGGKGKDEVIAEGDAIKKYLLDNKINEKNILVENKSKSTYENIKFSYKLIKDKKAHVAYSTTNYHVFRAGLLATNQGLYMEGIGSKTKTYYWINAFIREFVGSIYAEKKRHLVFISLILIILIFMIIITYFANNIF